MKPLYLANAKSSTPVSDDNMTTLTMPRYATAADITSALALYATSAQLPRSWLNMLSAINKHTLTPRNPFDCTRGVKGGHARNQVVPLSTCEVCLVC